MKKNTLKKIMSTVLSVAMLVSMMIVPANASGDTLSVIHYNAQTGITETIEIPSDETIFSDEGTRKLLDPAIQQAMNEKDAEMANSVGARHIIGKDNREDALPAYDPFSGVVLIKKTCRDADGEIYSSLSTGFLVAPKVVVTAAHCIAPNESKASLGDLMEVVSVVVYYGVWTSIDGVGSYEDYPSVTAADRYYPEVYDDARTGSSNANIWDYDWGVLTLENEINNRYYFDCACVNNTASLEGRDVTITGYPGDFRYYMKTATGKVEEVNSTERQMEHNVDSVSGQSGSPMYSPTTYTVFGINTSESGENVDPPINGGTIIIPEVYNAICTAIQNAASS